MDRIKCWYNTPLQVLTAAPALHSLSIFQRDDVTVILEFLNHIRGDLRKLILKYCILDDDYGLLASIVALNSGLEGLSLEGCYSLTPLDYGLIAHLQKLSELNLTNCQVYYVCVKLLETHVWICEHM